MEWPGDFIMETVVGDCRGVMAQIPDESIHCCITSPPYWGLRDYGVEELRWPPMTYRSMSDPSVSLTTIPEWHGCLGLEPTPEMYVGHVVLAFRHVKRVLRSDGTLWLNVGDSYASAWACARQNVIGSASLENGTREYRPNRLVGHLKEKDLVGIPWRIAFALQADGWYLRSDIIWSKPNPMPESVTDRPTKSHEYLFLLAKSRRYYYDHKAIRRPVAESTLLDKRGGDDGDRKDLGYPGQPSRGGTNLGGPRKSDKQRGHGRRHDGFNDRWDSMTKEEQQHLGRNKRSVWEVATKPYKEAHFATFPPDLIVDCVKAGCPPGGIVLDPFAGSGTTGEVAQLHGRKYVLIELNPEYKRLADKRTSQKNVFTGAGQ